MLHIRKSGRGDQRPARQRYASVTPLLTAGLLIDLRQQILPFAIPGSDRSEYLERAFESSWENALKRTTKKKDDNVNFFALPVSQSWTADSGRPALVFNTTIVETGEPLVISRLAVSRVEKDAWRLHNFDDVSPAAGPSVSVAAGLSARFPFVTPGARLQNELFRSNGLPATLHLVDGGYFDASGIVASRELVGEIVSTVNTDERFKEFRDKFYIHNIIIAHGLAYEEVGGLLRIARF